MQILKSRKDLVIITMPVTIGNKLFTMSGLSSITIPSRISKTPRVTKPLKKMLVYLSNRKYKPLIIRTTDKKQVTISNDVAGLIVNISPIINITMDSPIVSYNNLFSFFSILMLLSIYNFILY